LNISELIGIQDVCLELCVKSWVTGLWALRTFDPETGFGKQVLACRLVFTDDAVF